MKVLILLIMSATMATSRSSHSTAFPKENQNEKDAIMQNLKKLKEILLDKVKSARTKAVEEHAKEELAKEERKAKSLNYYPYFPPPLMQLNYPGYYPQSKDFHAIIPDEWISRTEPFKRKTTHLLDSPTYYIRLPPNPYVFVPGMGYISRPPTVTDPEVLNTIPAGTQEKPDPFYHLPINFMSNGKPTSVFQLPNEQLRPKPDTSILSLNKGPYLFNGKPTDIYLLRNSFNALYADALTNFYP